MTKRRWFPEHKALRNRWSALVAARAGNVALVAALVVGPVGVGFSALAVDFVTAHSVKEELQAAADGAALAAARELPLGSTSRTTVAAIVDAYAQASIDPRITLTKIDSGVIGDREGVRVVLQARVASIFGGLFHAEGYTPHAEAVARLAGGMPICALVLDTLGNQALHLEKQARVVAKGCAVVSNSTHRNGVTLKDSAEIEAGMICSAGGAAGKKASFLPDPVTDCPAVPDPLANRPEPAVGACTHLLPVVVSGATSLKPGVYCGGLIVRKGATASLAPGVYVMKNGPLNVLDGGALRGENVGFYFVGDLATMRLEGDSQVELTAPRDGPMAGFLLFAERVLLTGKAKLRRFVINSNDAREMLGTIYLRDGVLEVAASAPIADRSAYTVIVARNIQVSAGPDLVLNSDYDATDVPVPEGVGPRAPQAFLAE